MRPIAAGHEAPRVRPRCVGCSKRREPWYVGCDEHGQHSSYFVASPTHRAFYDWKGYGHFCTLRCATEWANRRVDRRLSA